MFHIFNTLHSTKPELRFCAGSNPACGMSEIHDGENLWQWSRLEIRLTAFRRSTIPQKQFIIIIMTRDLSKQFSLFWLQQEKLLFFIEIYLTYRLNIYYVFKNCYIRLSLLYVLLVKIIRLLFLEKLLHLQKPWEMLLAMIY